MTEITPNFNLVAPSPSTPLRDLGPELYLMVQSIETTLGLLTYNGADPNLVLSRTAALEAWRATAQAAITTLQTESRTMGYKETIAQTTFTGTGTTLTTLTGAIATSVDVTVDKPTEVMITARCGYIAPTGASGQFGVNLTGATQFTTPTDDPSVGKASQGTDVIPISQLIKVLNPGTTQIRLAARQGGGSATLRNPSILVQRI